MSLHFRLSKSKLLFCFLLSFSLTSFSQITSGLIVEPATGAGRIVLDPNLDGYTSLTTAGFSGLDDQTSAASEIVFKKMTLFYEPPADLGAGPNCNYTDFVRDTINANMNSAGGNFLDANNNWIFRLRLGTYSPNTKSYSILIDTDGKFGNSGPNADAQYVEGNPGFEIEILLSTNNGVYVYDVNNNTNNSVLKRSYTVTTNYQKSKALSQICGSYDFFLDLFVPFADLTTDFGITTSTPLRYALTNNMSAFQSTIGHLSNISDVWGINGSNNEAGLKTFIENMTPTCASYTPTGLRSACPIITAPIQNGATTVTGTSTEANGTIITLYKNGVATAFTGTVSSGTWTISSISPALATGDLIGATATASGKGESIYNCNIVTVTACGVVTTLVSANVTGNPKGVCGAAGAGTDNASIRIYQAGVRLVPTQGIGADTITVLTNGSFTWKANASNTNCNSGAGSLSGNGSATQIVNGCESAAICVNFSGGTTTTAAPVITPFPLINTQTSVSGTSTANAFITLYKGGNTVLGTTTASAGGAWTISSLTLADGDILTAKAQVGTDCQSAASATVTVSRVTTAPVVTASACGSSVISGTSSEATGTRIKLYKNGTLMNAGAADSTTVTSNGTWSTTVVTSLTAGDVITAKARITNGTLSSASNSVTYTTKTSNSVAITGSYTNQSTSVSGTGTNGDIIRLYVDGTALATTATVSGGTWTIAVTAGLDLFKGAVLTATATTGANCESNASSSVTVTSVAPTAINVTQTVSTCNGIASISVPNTQNGILYQLYDGATPFSNGLVGNGGTITLLSSFVNTTKTGLTVKATSIIDETSTATMTGTVTINIQAADSTWRGTYSTDWFDYRNWCLNGAIPTSTIKAKILGGTPFSPIIAASGAVCNELILYSGSSLSSSTNQNLDVYGAWINNGGTYTANSGSITFRGTDTLSIRGTTSTTFGNVTMNLTGTAGNDFITLAKPMTVTGLLTLTDGRVITSSTNLLSLTSTASSTGGSTASFVDGPMEKAGTTAFTFPVGDGTLYAPIATGTPTSSTTYRAQYFETAYANTSSMAGSPTPVLGSVSLTEYWQLDRTAGTGDATVKLYWDNTNNGSSISSCPDLRVGYFNGSAWTNPSDSSTTAGTGCPSPTGTGTIETDNNLTSFGTFTLGTIGAAPLPVKLISFIGKCLNEDVILKWTTASELNNDYFTLERGINGTDVKPIATIKGSGTSNQLLNYQYIDSRAIGDNQPEGTIYYRLKQTDFDGKFDYSNFIAVKNCNDVAQEILLYPNVSNGTVQVNSHNKIVSHIDIYNSLGSLVYSSPINNSKEELFLNLPLGMYYYFISNNDEQVGKGKLIIK